MNLEKLLEQHLQASAADMPPYPADVEAIKSRGNRRRLMNRLVIATGVAAALVATIVLATSLLQGQPDVVQPAPPTTAPEQTAVPTIGTTLNDVVAFYGDDGITLQADGVDRALDSDLYYEYVYALTSDGEGGLLFQYGLTPPPWTRDSIMRLAPGASQPEIVVDGDNPPGSSRLLLGLVEGGFSYADYVDAGNESALTVRIAAVDGTDSRVALEVSYPVGVANTELIAAQGNRIVVVEYSNCAAVHVYDLTGQPVGPDATLDCGFTPSDMALSPNGSQLIVLGRTDENVQQLRTFDTLTRSVTNTLDISVDTWVVAWSSEQEALVVGSDGAGTIRFDNGQFRRIRTENNFRLAAIDTVAVADDATTGSGMAQFPCNPATGAALEVGQWRGEADQPVIDTWERLRNLAATCEWEQLSDIAEQDQTNLSFGGNIRLARLWILDANNGFDTGEQLLDVTSVPPARTSDGWVWPAVSSTNSADDWQVLIDAEILTPDEVTQMQEFGGYIGLRVGIADDGTWLFSIAGD